MHTYTFQVRIQPASRYQTSQMSPMLGTGSYRAPRQGRDGGTAASRHGWAAQAPRRTRAVTGDLRTDCTSAPDSAARRGHRAWRIRCHSLHPYTQQIQVPNLDVPVPPHVRSRSPHRLRPKLSKTRMR